MPTYSFQHRQTGEIEEHMLSIAQMEQYKLDHLDVELVILSAPSVGDPFHLGHQKPPEDFLRNVIEPIQRKSGSDKVVRSLANFTK